jgi:hypothetical protein
MSKRLSLTINVRSTVDEAVLLADARFVLKPDLDGRTFGKLLQRLTHASGKVFLKVSITPSFCLG